MKRIYTFPLPVFCLLAASVLFVAACGQRGPLFLPDEKQSAPVTQAEEPGDDSANNENEDEDEGQGQDQYEDGKSG